MILGLGADLVEVARLARAVDRTGPKLLDRLFTPAEQDECVSRRTPAVHLAARFAAKEAALKALGIGWGGGIRWKDLEILRGGNGRPALTLRGRARELAEERGVRGTLVSLSHDGGFALAVVIAVGDGAGDPSTVSNRVQGVRRPRGRYGADRR